MGKFERGEAEQLEMSLVDYLNGYGRTNAHKCTSSLVAAIIRSNINCKIKHAVFIGRTYSEPGDVKLITEDGKTLYVELKLVKSGKGTRANISQDALTDLELLYDDNGCAISWSRFRELHKFDARVLSELDRFQKYPQNIRTKEEKAKYLIENFIRPSRGEPVEKRASEILMTCNDPLKRMAAEIVLNIAKLAREDKLKYIQYLKNLKQNNDNIKKFAILLLLGFHKEDSLKEGFKNFDQIIRALQSGGFNIKTYYVIKNSCKVYIEDLSCLIPKLLNTHFRIEFPENQTNVIISYYNDQSKVYMPLLRVVFHWKNIFQGIKTPCLNVFDEGILKNYLTCS